MIMMPQEDKQIISLSAMSLGQVGFIVGFSLETKDGERVQAMGLVPGEQVEVVRRASSDGSIEIKIRSYFRSLRKPEADLIKVKLLA